MKARTQDEVQDGKKGRNLLSNLLVVVGEARDAGMDVLVDWGLA